MARLPALEFQQIGVDLEELIVLRLAQEVVAQLEKRVGVVDVAVVDELAGLEDGADAVADDVGTPHDLLGAQRHEMDLHGAPARPFVGFVLCDHEDHLFDGIEMPTYDALFIKWYLHN